MERNELCTRKGHKQGSKNKNEQKRDLCKSEEANLHCADAPVEMLHNLASWRRSSEIDNLGQARSRVSEHYHHNHYYQP